MRTLASQFKSALSFIEIKGRERDYAIAAHTEIRKHLEADEQLCAWGIETVLIGSYARHTGIWPGKDVDVFAKLKKLSVGEIDPRTVFEQTKRVLVKAYGDRAEPQNRSVKINFSQGEFEFSVDVVPAVRWQQRWAIPRRDTATWDEREDQKRWVETDPEVLEKLTEKLNKKFLVDGQGAYVPTVKLVRQARKHHRDKAKPGGFYFEVMSYWAFESEGVSGDSFAEIFADTLDSIARQLQSGDRLKDPVLGEDFKPEPDPQDRTAAGQVFADLAAKAREAITTDDICKAGALWRQILGQNAKGWCFPVPDGCDEQGRKLAVSSAATSRGSRERGGFA